MAARRKPKDVWEATGEFLAGSGERPGFLGTGMYEVQAPTVGEAPRTPREAQLERERQQQMEALRGRQAPTVTAATIDTGAQAQTRGFQTGALDLMRQAATGGAPSVAELLLGRGTQQVQRQQLAVAQGARGLAGAAALRAAQERGAMAGQEAAGQAAILRAQEMATGREQLAGAATGARAQDIGLAAQQAEFQQQAALQNAAIQQRTQEAVDQMTLALIAQGYSAAEAQQAAMQRWEELRVRAALEVEQLQQTAYQQAAGRNLQATQAVTGGLANVFGLGAQPGPAGGAAGAPTSTAASLRAGASSGVGF